MNASNQSNETSISEANMSNQNLKVGSFYQKLSVKLPEMLTGHINRNQPAKAFLDYPEIHAIIINQNSATLVLVSIDLLEMDTEICTRIRQRIADELNLSRNNILIACTHAHTLPAAIKLGTVDISEDFVASMSKEILHCALEASKETTECRLLVSQIDCPGISVNRRKIIDSQVVMSPNPNGTNDTRILTYWFVDNLGRPISCIVNFNMHATVLDVSIFKVSADYPRFLRHALDKELPNINTLFFNGACGDVRPCLMHEDGGFRGGSEEDLIAIGTKLGNKVIESLKGASQEEAQLDIRSKQIKLFYDHEAREKAKDRTIVKNSTESRQINQDLMEAAFAEWRKTTEADEAQNGRKRTILFEIQAIILSEKSSILALPAEIFVETGLNIKGRSRYAQTMVTGYANGSIGYVPTEEACLLGGYEAQDAYKLYGHPAPFKPDTAIRIEEASGELLSY